MKRKIAVFLVFTILLVNIFSVNAFANNITPRNNNTASTTTDFIIYDTGVAKVACNYTGYPNIATGATIEILIQKRNLLFFWENYVRETTTVQGERYDDVSTFTLAERGTYKCTVTYTIYGTAGEADVIPFERTLKY